MSYAADFDLASPLKILDCREVTGGTRPSHVGSSPLPSDMLAALLPAQSRAIVSRGATDETKKSTLLVSLSELAWLLFP
jgi:hypothetical protein